jgi:hypothetical protein
MMSAYKFKTCLVVSRHQLLEMQQKDIEQICENMEQRPELPTDPNTLKQAIQTFDAIIGSLPLALQIQILQQKKTFVSFVMTSQGVASTKEEAEKIASQWPGRTVILAPSRPGDMFRVTRYDGLKLVKEIKVIDEWLIQHP